MDGEGCIPNLRLLRKDGPSTPAAPRHGLTTVTYKDVEYCLLDTVAERNMTPIRQRLTRLHARPLCERQVAEPALNQPQEPLRDMRKDDKIEENGLATIRERSDKKEAMICIECLTSLRNGTVPEASLVRIDSGLPPPDLEPLTPLELQLVSLNRSMRSVSVAGVFL